MKCRRKVEVKSPKRAALGNKRGAAQSLCAKYGRGKLSPTGKD
jgi:hypothetical protein